MSFFNKVFNFLIQKCLFEEYCFYINGPETLPPPLSKEEEQEIINMIRMGDDSKRDLLVTHNLRLVVYIAKKYESKTAGAEDLVSIGTIGLIKAVKTFNPDKNIKIATYASRCIENEILMYLRKASNSKSEMSFDEPLSVDWDGNEMTLSDVLGSEPDEISQEIEYEDEKRLLRYVVSKLSQSEKNIMERRFGLNGAEMLTQKELADDMGISQSYISRLEKRILSKIKEEMQKHMIAK
ncbi:MAG: sigma-70 family RNA polymerase sigma factor [Eubacterium sp.]|nr:sigma-70 family RNA polymerase sigma factor [Eubacterium sp.]